VDESPSWRWDSYDNARVNINEGEIIESGATEKIIAGEVVRLIYPEEGFKCGCDLKLF
jgi:ABC-type lipopolysaccharide export system ATPase subunit